MLRRIIIACALVVSLVIPIPAFANPNLTVGVAYDIGGRGDRSFNDAAAAGLQKAQKQFDFDVVSARIWSKTNASCNASLSASHGSAGCNVDGDEISQLRNQHIDQSPTR